MNMLADILASRVRAEIFRLLFGHEPSRLHMRELERRSGCVIGTIQKELKKLLRLGLVRQQRDGNRLYYEANSEHPLYPDIRSMVAKTSGVFERLRSALASEDRIGQAFVFGSFARGEEHAGSDLDLLVIGELGLRQLVALLSEVALETGREINPHVMSADEFVKRLRQKDHFVEAVMASEKVFVKGGADDLEKLEREPLAS